MFALFRHDAYRWAVFHLGRTLAGPHELTRADLLRLLYQHLALRALAWFRLGSWFKQRRIPVVPGFIQRLIYRRYGLEIIVGGDIGGGLYIAHPIGTVISAQRIGANCSIIAAVTIGMRNAWAFPIIGDDVFIGAGARVLGGITIGDKAVIGANAVVIHDIPAGATAVGIPARVVQRTTNAAEEAMPQRREGAKV